MDLVMGRLTEDVLIIQCPPRHGKSEYISKRLTSWFLGSYPKKRVILTSYEASYARTWGRRSRDHLRELLPLFPGTELSTAQSTMADWETTEGGGMVTAGAGGPITGRGADLFVIDDPVKNHTEALSERFREDQWEWWLSTAKTRIEPGGKVVLIMTRWHKDDLGGRLVRESEWGDGMPVKLLNMPAIAEENDSLNREWGEPLWPERFGREALDKLKASNTSYWWNALYQQRPSQAGETEWPADYFKEHIWADRWPDKFEVSAIAVDPSKGASDKGDFSAIVFAGVASGKLWIDSIVERIPSERIADAVIDWYLEYLPDRVAIESNAFQHLFRPIIEGKCSERQIAPLPISLMHNRVNKNIRIGRIGPHLEAQNIRLRRTRGNRTLYSQLEEWPVADYDDGPDGLEMAIRTIVHLNQQHRRSNQETMVVL